MKAGSGLDATKGVVTVRVLGLSLLMLSGAHSSASGQFIREGSIGKATATQQQAPQSDSCAFRKLSAMKGEKLLFLPKYKSGQQYGYQDFKGGAGEFGHPTYKEAVGRIGVLTVISGDATSATITMVDNQQVYTAEPLLESISGIAFISDLECAKKQLLGKTIWYIGEGGINVYDETTDKTTKLDEPKPVKLNVKNVVASWFSDTPVRLIVTTDSGAEAFVDVTLSGITVMERPPEVVFNFRRLLFVGRSSNAL